MKEIREFWDRLMRGEGKVSHEETVAAFARLLAMKGDLEMRIREMEEEGQADACDACLNDEPDRCVGDPCPTYHLPAEETDG